MIEISPNDVLLFRESRDFSAGENHVAVSTEPLPHTIAGALMGFVYRTLSEYDATKFLNLDERRDLAKRGVTSDWKPNFSILGTLFAVEDSPVFPLPKDMVTAKSEVVSNGWRDKIDVVVPLRLRRTLERNVVVARLPDGKETLHFGPATGFLTEGELRRYLKGDDENVDVMRTSEVYVRENRIGIGLTDGKVTDEGMLYRTINLRLREKTTLRVYFEENEEKLTEILGEAGLLKLGGESRFARFNHKPEGFPFKGKMNIKEGQTVRLYFATPVIPEEGLDGLIEELDINADVIQLFTDRKVRVTGWDIQMKMPKESLYAFPAGTVVWLKAYEDMELDVVNKVGLMKALGYGLVLAGVVE